MTEQRVALVTGGNKGIGLQIAKDLAARGLTVLVGSRDLAKGEEAATTIGPNAHAIQLNVTDQASIDAAAGRIRSDWGRLDVLMNNAGISHAGRPGRSFENLRDVRWSLRRWKTCGRCSRPTCSASSPSPR